jgi:hypothetical protein
LIETYTLSATDITASNVETHTLSITDPDFATTSNYKGLIHMNGYNMSELFPTADGSVGDTDWWFNVERKDAPIHPSWIQDDQNILSDLWNAAELGVDLAQTLADAYQFFQGGQDGLTQGAIDALNNALDNLGDETSSNPKIAVSWSNIKNRPIATSSTSVGVRGDIYVADAQSLKSIPANQFSTNAYGQLEMNTSGADTIINFGAKEAFVNSNTT